MRLAPDRSLTIRYRLRGFVSGGSTTFALAIHDPSVAPGTDPSVTFRQAVALAATAATSDGWFGEGIVTLGAGELVPRSRPTRDIAGGDAAVARFHEVYVTVLASNATVATATLTGVYAAAYIGL